MLDIKVTIKNDKVVIDGLKSFAGKIPAAVRRGLKRSARGIFAGAFKWLSGPGAKKSSIPAGEYPVPVRTGHLRRSLYWLDPGATKTVNNLSFTAGPFEAIVGNAAEYADIITEGKGSSSKYGERQFVKDALEIYNRDVRIKRNIESEINKITPK